MDMYNVYTHVHPDYSTEHASAVMPWMALAVRLEVFP